MDIQATNQQSISDDQELAKVLAGITQQADNPVSAAPEIPEIDEDSMAAASAPPEEPSVVTPTPVTPAPAATAPVSALSEAKPSADTTGLESIKQDALKELRPLVDKLDLPADEKFDTYLLLLRSTDDAALIAPAFEAAQAISDEARRAQALLDIIKEIDYLSAAK